MRNDVIKFLFCPDLVPLPEEVEKASITISQYFSTVSGIGFQWMGYGVQQNIIDTMMVAEAIQECKPNRIIESGTGGGGHTLFMANILDIMAMRGIIQEDYKVITIDNRDICKPPQHEHIVSLTGDSVDSDIVAKVQELVPLDISSLVILDSSHDHAHVLQEMNIYSQFVSLDSFLIVQDTFMGLYNDVEKHWWRFSPLGAVVRFLWDNTDFRLDVSKNRWLVGYSPCGFIKRCGQKKDENITNSSL